MAELKSRVFIDYPIYLSIEAFDSKVGKSKVLDQINECIRENTELEPLASR